MGFLGRVESRLEGAVRGGFARVFRSQLEPVEIAAALQRHAAGHLVVVAAGRSVAPNRYAARLAPTDAERLLPYAEPLQRELADLLVSHVRDAGWQTYGPVVVRLEADEDVDPGVVRVQGTVDPQARADVGGAGGQAPQPVGSAPGRRRTSTGSSSSVPDPWASHAASAATPPTRAMDALEVAEAPLPPVRGPRDGRPRLVVEAPGAPPAEHELGGPTTVVGRGGEADVTLPDPGVSRRHAELRVQADGVWVHDLGSTNGLRVNGRSTAAAPLADGDRLEVGSSVLVFRRDG